MPFSATQFDAKMDERSKRLAAAKQKLQVYKLQNQRSQTQPAENQNHTNPAAVVIPQTHSHQDQPVDFPQSHNTSQSQTPNLSQRSSPGLSTNTGPFTPSSWTDEIVSTPTTTTLFTNPSPPPNPESYFTVTPLVPVNGAFPESLHQSPHYEPGNSQQYEYSNPTPNDPYQHQSQSQDTTASNSAPVIAENNCHPQEYWHVQNNTHEYVREHPDTRNQENSHNHAHPHEEKPSHHQGREHEHQDSRDHTHDHVHVHGNQYEHRHEEEVELRSMQNHGHAHAHGQQHHHPHEHNYFQQSSQGQDAFELELSQLRQDNAHLSRRETELIGQLQDTEKTLQDLRKERDNLAQEVRSELGPLKDKVNVLFEENQIFRLKLDEMTGKVDIAEAEKLRNEAKFEEMETAFIIVSNAKMELAAKLDVEKETVKALNVTIQEKDNQIQTLTIQNQELTKSAADLEKALDSYAEENIDLDEENTKTELMEAHAKIVLLEKELNELRTIVNSKAASSGSGQHHHEENLKRDHDHDHGPGQHHGHSENDHDHGHDNHQHGGHDHPHPPAGRGPGQSHGHDHDKDHGRHHDHQHEGDTHSHTTECDHEHGHEDDHSQEHEQGLGHGHSHDHGQGHGHSHDHGQGHGHSHGNGSGGHSHDSDLGKGGHELTPMEKKQARLEWENQTYREELEKLASLLKVKTADATALSIYREENEKMKNELARLEHMVIQLQGENDTIGDYITLYQSQKLALKEKALQKEAEMVTLGKEREQLRVRMEELNQILRSYNKNENQPELPVHKINELISEINTNFHPCGVCSGRLLNV